MDITGEKEVAKAIKKVSKTAKGELAKVINRGCILIASNAKKRIQKGPKSGIVYEKYRPRRTHQASAKGQAPATDLGTLVNNIEIKLEDKGLTGWIISKALYSKWLEHEPLFRPFMYPAYNEEKKEIIKDLKELG